ncbi:MAG: DUF4290 domain-containing protein [Bacteroidales bacterium]|jgi:hypothetical protein|nr:DUF4290 domain-containing protein [Bacteroidales bacterium]
MKYNTQRSPLRLFEYGRGIQEMVDHAIAIEDRKKRNDAAKIILKSMLILNPSVKQTDDYMHTLYDHLFIVSDFKLDIDSPFPKPDNTFVAKKYSKPIKIDLTPIRFRYYGKTLEAMIRKASEMPDGEEKIAALNLITVQMKKHYYLWNADLLSDELIANHLQILTDGKLQYTEEMKSEVYSHFYNRPSLEHKSKYIDVSAYGQKQTGGKKNALHNGQRNGSHNGSHNGQHSGPHNKKSFKKPFLKFQKSK